VLKFVLDKSLGRKGIDFRYLNLNENINFES
jgi:hypothetical protein